MMRRPTPSLGSARTAGALLCALLASCASVHWERAGTDAATADQDLRHCELQAKAYGREAAAIKQEQPAVIVSPKGEAGVAVPAPGAAHSDVAAEYEALRSCMRGKGYRQRPGP